MKKNKVRTAAESRAALYKTGGPDFVALTRRCQDITTELHGLGNELHKAGLHPGKGRLLMWPWESSRASRRI